jgi:hypothetical protein
LLLDAVDFTNAAFVSLFGQVGREKRGHDFLYLIEGILTAAKCQHIGAVVFARVSSQRGVVTRGRANARNLVGRHRAPDSSSIDDDADIGASFADGFCDSVSVIGIIYGIRGIRPKIIYLNSKACEKLFELLFEGISAVIGARALRCASMKSISARATACSRSKSFSVTWSGCDGCKRRALYFVKPI